MSTISVFIHITIDGFYAGPNGEIDWFKTIQKDDEFDALMYEQSKSGAALVFGRTTYEMMKSYWPTPEAIQADPEMAAVMDNSPKIVFSKTLESVEEGPNWKNIRLLREIDRDEIAGLKKQGDVVILGSGTIVQQFSNLGLIDQYQLVVVPIVLGEGKSLFKNVPKKELHLSNSRSFQNGVVVLDYTP